ncbi:hypothetical protein D3C71_1165280 [compost metagenome]
MVAVAAAGPGAEVATVALACWRTDAVSKAVARAASLRACAVWAAVGAGVCAGAAAGVEAAGVGKGVAAGVGAGALATVVAAGASPGHSITKRDSSPCLIICGRNGATDSARSNTTRNVPGTGCPVRTAVTTPLGAGSLRLRIALESGKSTTRRFGPASDRVL